MKKIVLLSGFPSTGKSQLVSAAEEYGAFALNLEARSGDAHSLESTNLRGPWDEFCANGAPAFMDALNHRPEELVLVEWGFPIPCLPMVQRLQQQGVRAWWLNADHEAAKAKHQESGKSMPAFTAQVAAIANAWPILNSFYGARQIDRLRPDGTFKDDWCVFEIIFGKRMYHGGPIQLPFLRQGSCVSSIDYAAQYAWAKVPSSQGYRKEPGFIHEVLVEPDQVYRDEVDLRISLDLEVTKVIPAKNHQVKSAAELLGD